jgi:hypothetical protein
MMLHKKTDCPGSTCICSGWPNSVMVKKMDSCEDGASFFKQCLAVCCNLQTLGFLAFMPDLVNVH